MYLEVQRHLAALETGDHRDLPQRAAAVQQRGVQAGHQGLQLGVAARRGQGDGAHVVIPVDVVVAHPDRVGQVEGHQGQPARQQVGEVLALLQVVAHVFAVVAPVAFGQVQHMQRGHVHRGFGTFNMKKGGIKAAQMVHGVLRSDGVDGVDRVDPGRGRLGSGCRSTGPMSFSVGPVGVETASFRVRGARISASGPHFEPGDRPRRTRPGGGSPGPGGWRC